MASIPRMSLFGWKDIEGLGFLERLRLVLQSLPDEALMRGLESKRGKGRDDYPIRPLFNSILAGVVFERSSIASLRRELLRNAPLRQVCGFDLLRSAKAVPPPYVYTRFLKLLMVHGDWIEAMFEEWVGSWCDLLPGFGSTLAIDGKAIATHARPRGKGASVPEPDGRRDTEADFGVKTTKSKRTDGTVFERVKKWFGYKIHLIVDASYELPVAFEVTRASRSEVVVAHEMVDRLEKDHPDRLDRCEVLSGDKGYDDSKLIDKLWNAHRIKSVIAIRNQWKDGEATHYGLACQGAARCPVAGAVRIKRDQDPRVFTPPARSSYAWQRVYKTRTSVERVNSRLDVSFGFERHFLRGLAKMRLRCGLALLVMLAMAKGRIEEKQKDKLRNLVAAA